MQRCSMQKRKLAMAIRCLWMPLFLFVTLGLLNGIRGTREARIRRRLRREGIDTDAVVVGHWVMGDAYYVTYRYYRQGQPYKHEEQVGSSKYQDWPRGTAASSAATAWRSARTARWAKRQTSSCRSTTASGQASPCTWMIWRTPPTTWCASACRAGQKMGRRGQSRWCARCPRGVSANKLARGGWDRETAHERLPGPILPLCLYVRHFSWEVRLCLRRGVILAILEPGLIHHL